MAKNKDHYAEGISIVDNRDVTDIIFDFFGTLVNYSAKLFNEETPETLNFLRTNGFEVEISKFEQTWEQCFLNLESEAEKTHKEFHMLDVGRLFFKSVFDIVPSNQVNEGFIETFIREWSRGIVFHEGILEFIESLSCKYRLSIISNTYYPPLIHQNLNTMKIKRYFSVITSSIEFGIRKPNPKIFEHTLNMLGTNSARSVFVGDSYKDDFLGARGVGMPCYLIDTKRQYHDEPRRIEHIFELKNILL